MIILNHIAGNFHYGGLADGNPWSLPFFQKAFTCFCSRLYFISNFKDFNTTAPA
jgi:hypothetical protein